MAGLRWLRPRGRFHFARLAADTLRVDLLFAALYEWADNAAIPALAVGGFGPCTCRSCALGPAVYRSLKLGLFRQAHRSPARCGEFSVLGRVDRATDPASLRYQYGTTDKLDIRIEAHQRYSERPDDYLD